MNSEDDPTLPFARPVEGLPEVRCLDKLTDEDAINLSQGFPPNRMIASLPKKRGLFSRLVAWLSGTSSFADPDTDEEAAMARQKVISESEWEQPNEYIKHGEGTPRPMPQQVRGTPEDISALKEVARIEIARLNKENENLKRQAANDAVSIDGFIELRTKYDAEMANRLNKVLEDNRQLSAEKTTLAEIATKLAAQLKKNKKSSGLKKRIRP